MRVKKGDVVKLEYVGTLDDGTIFESSEDMGQPLEFEVEEGNLMKGFYQAVIGMEIGEEREFKVAHMDGYGEWSEELVMKVPRDKFPDDPVPEPGMMFFGETEDGEKIPSLIKEVTDAEVVIDINHPLAGQDLNFKVKLLSIDEE